MQDNRPLRQKLQTRWAQLDNERSTWVSDWRALSEYLLPRAGRFTVSDRNKGGQGKFDSIIDSTGTKAVHTLGAGLMAGMTSPARPWFRLATGDPKLNEVESVKEWLSDATKLMLEVFHRSNTYRALHTIYEELGVFGTGATLILPNFRNVVHHHPQTIGEYALATDPDGRVNTFARQFDMTVAQVVKEFGYENVSKNVRQLFDKGILDGWITVMHIIEPREDRDLTKRDAKNMAFRSTYFEHGQNSKNETEDNVLRDGGFKRFNVLAPRWMVHGGDIYGVSPGMEAIGDVKSLQYNQMNKAIGIEYQVKPTLAMPSSMRGHEIDSLPGGHLFYDGATPQPIRNAFDVNINLQHLLLDIQDTRERIRSSFYADLFMMIANDNRSNITAREIAERHEEKLLMLGPVLERLHDEMLNPLVDITFDQMLEANILPPPPPELNGADLNVEFVSMLAQAQRAVGISGVERLTMFVGQLAAGKQDMGVWDKIDLDNMVDGYADMTGVDPRYIVGNDRVAIIRDQRAQQQQMMQAMAAAQQIAATAKDASAAQANAAADPNASDPLSDVTRQFTQL